jgi:hypothetical protein
MEKFVVPQFLDTEGKIFGPITVRQFLILVVDFFFIFLCYKFFASATFLIIGLFLLATGIIIAFVKVNGRSIQYFILNVFESLRRPHLRVWQQVEIKEGYRTFKKGRERLETPPPPRKPLQHSRLSNLSLTVDTGGRYHEETEGIKIQSLDTSPE